MGLPSLQRWAFFRGVSRCPKDVVHGVARGTFLREGVGPEGCEGNGFSAEQDLPNDRTASAPVQSLVSMRRPLHASCECFETLSCAYLPQRRFLFGKHTLRNPPNLIAPFPSCARCLCPTCLPPRPRGQPRKVDQDQPRTSSLHTEYVTCTRRTRRCCAACAHISSSGSRSSKAMGHARIVRLVYKCMQIAITR